MDSLKSVYLLFFNSETERVSENPTVDQYLVYEKFMALSKKLCLIPGLFEKGKEYLFKVF